MVGTVSRSPAESFMTEHHAMLGIDYGLEQGLDLGMGQDGVQSWHSGSNKLRTGVCDAKSRG
jgi:hypothetical protein